MCHFITLIAPTQDADAVREVMERHGRAAQPIDNPSVRKALRQGERQYLTTRGPCDCGTVLAAQQETPEALEQQIAKEAARLKRKGWSAAKVTRAMEDGRKADARPSSRLPDSLELWNGALRDLGEELKLPYAGLLVRAYSGSVETETFSAARREVASTTQWHDALGSVAQDEVTIFSLSLEPRRVAAGS